MKKAYIHGNLFNQKHDAFIVENGKFIQFGSSSTILKQDIDEIIDLNGDTVLPGFHDSHLHLLGIGKSMEMFNAAHHQTISALIDAAKNHPARPFLGRGWHESQFAEKRALTKDDLNQISADDIVIIYRVCGHMVVANDAAIEALNKLNIPLPEDQESYDLTLGHFKESAIKTIMHVLPRVDEETLKRQLLIAQEHLLSQGVTAIGSDDFSMYEVPFETIFETMKIMAQDGSLKLRILEQCNLPNYDDFTRFIEKGYPNTTYGRYKIGPLKLFADGSLGARTALLSQPYNDADTLGIRIFHPDQLRQFITTANNHGIDVAIHAIGDQIIEEILDIIQAIPLEQRKNRRHSLIHAQLARLDQLIRMRVLNVGAQTQPIFINSDIDIIESRLGLRITNSYLFNTMNKIGIPTTLSTDAPVESVNPFENLYVAVTRTSIKHPEKGIYLPTEAFSVVDAIKAYTEAPSYFSYQEASLGKLKKGYLADFIVVENLSLNHPETFRQCHVVETYIEGEKVYQKT